jgi:hypothetical protein
LFCLGDSALVSAYESGSEEGPDLQLTSGQPLLAPFSLQDLTADLEAALMGLTVQVCLVLNEILLSYYQGKIY